MKNVYFVRHGETYATEHGLIQGSANGEKNRLSETGVQNISTLTSKEIMRIIKDHKLCEVYLYLGTQARFVETADFFAPTLVYEGILQADDEHIVADTRLNGRDYGMLEGYNEKELRKPKNFILKPTKTWSYLFAQAGLSNLAKVEKKNEYEQKVYEFIQELMFTHDGHDDHLVFIVSGSDFFKTMQRCKDISRLCYFGDEELDIQENSHGMQSTMKIGCGEVKHIIIEKPDYIKSRGTFRPTAEKYATTKFINYGDSKTQE